MLKWLGGSGGTGDGTDAKLDVAAAKSFIASLPPEDPVRAAQDVALWLEGLNTEAATPVALRYEIADLVDGALKRHGQRLLDQYLALKPQAKFQEGLIWRSVMGAWKSLGDAYVSCADQFAVEKSAVNRKKLVQALARAMRAQMLQIKWILLRYGYVGETCWKVIGHLHAQAEAAGCLEEVIEIYPGVHGQGTIRQELLRTLILAVSSTGGLSPLKQHVAERAIAHFSRDFVSSGTMAEDCNFVFDLNGSAPPARVYAEVPRNAKLFFFGASKALGAVQSVIDKLNDTGMLPADIGLQGTAPERVADALLHLAFNWEKELPERDYERRKVAMTLQVTQGFDGVQAGANAPVQETWVIENASDEGYGAIVPERRGDWLQVGVLVGMRPEEDGASWGAAIVRRVESDARGQRRAGLQVICRTALAGTMCTMRAAGGRGTPQAVTLLDLQPSKSGYMQVLVRPESFTLREEMELTRTMDGAVFVMDASGIVESGPDFDRVRFLTKALAEH